MSDTQSPMAGAKTPAQERWSLAMSARTVRLSLLLSALLAIVFAGGCAQAMAIMQPGPVDRSVLQTGVPRRAVLAYLGAPVGTDERPSQGVLVDTYKYTDGGKINSTGGKAARSIVYTIGDFSFLFLTQIVWIPIEICLDGTDYTATVEYRRSSSDGRWVARKVEEVRLR